MAQLRVVSMMYDYYPFDIRVRRLAEAAADAGYATDVICLRASGEAPYERCQAVGVYRVPLGRGFGRPLPITVLCWVWFALLAGVLLTVLHLRRRYDVIVVHNMPDFLVFAAILPKLLGAKVVLDIEDTSPELMYAKAHGSQRALLRRLAIWQERASTAFADYVLTVGWPFEQLLLARGVPEGRVTSIVNSADPKLFPAGRRRRAPADENPDGTVTVMYYGTVATRNGLDIAVRALALARRQAPRLRMAIMGRGEALAAVERLVCELGLADAVSFIPPCPSERIVDFILAGDLGIIPYRHDGFADLVLPTKMYELAWMQRAIIAADSPATRSLFGAEAVVLCQPEHPESFAQAIVALAEHPARRAQLIERAANAYQPYRWEVVRQRYQSLLAQVGARPVATQSAPHTT